MNVSRCRIDGTPLQHVFVDLGSTPLSNAFLKKSDLSVKEDFYPLKAYVCEKCLLVQLEEFEKPEKIFSEYKYFSSYSTLWLEHCRAYASMMIDRFSLGTQHQVIELASNDGCLLQNFIQKKMPVLGVEPAENVAVVARQNGVPTLSKFFGVKTARELVEQGIKADLLLGNNVLAHVPGLNDFVSGMKILLKSDGLITMEFPHLLQLIKKLEFDTIYHEHFSYFSFFTVEKLFQLHGLAIFDVEELTTHGGSLRIFAKHQDDPSLKIESRVHRMRNLEEASGFHRIENYFSFDSEVKKLRGQIVEFLKSLKTQGKTLVGYGAPAKGNILLNYCGIGKDTIDYTVDKNPHKQGLYLPGSQIPIFAPEKIKETKPDYVLILPWNIQSEILEQMAFIKEWGGKFITCIPEIRVQ